MTAEYEYENMKRAVESDRVVIFMRIRHNVFTSLAANCTVYYVNGLYSAACVGCCWLFKCAYVSLILHVAHVFSINDNLSLDTGLALTSFFCQYCDNNNSCGFVYVQYRQGSEQTVMSVCVHACESVLKVCIWGFARIQ